MNPSEITRQDECTTMYTADAIRADEYWGDVTPVVRERPQEDASAGEKAGAGF